MAARALYSVQTGAPGSALQQQQRRRLEHVPASCQFAGGPPLDGRDLQQEQHRCLGLSSGETSVAFAGLWNISGRTFVGLQTATGLLAATAAKGTLVGSANLCAGTLDSDWDNDGSSSRSCHRSLG